MFEHLRKKEEIVSEIKQKLKNFENKFQFYQKASKNMYNELVESIN